MIPIHTSMTTTWNRAPRNSTLRTYMAALSEELGERAYAFLAIEDGLAPCIDATSAADLAFALIGLIEERGGRP